MAKQNLAHLFLKGFVNELIKNTPIKEKQFVKQPQEFDAKKSEKEIQKDTTKMLPPLEKTIRTTTNPIKKIMHPIRKVTQKFRPQKATPTNFTQNIRNQDNLSKLQFLLRDPAVTEIECQGAEKNLIVRKGGILQRTKIFLKEDEITNLINEFSARTKIPIIGGTFKAAKDNLIMTAIISEVLGPRFIIQKRNPFEPLLPR